MFQTRFTPTKKWIMYGGATVLTFVSAIVVYTIMNGIPISLDRQAPVPPSSTDTGVTGSVATAPMSPGMVAKATTPSEVASSAKKAPPKAVKKAAPASSKSAPVTPVEVKADEATPPTVKPSEPATPPVPTGMASSSPADEELLITSTKSESVDAPTKASARFHNEPEDDPSVRSAAPAKAAVSTGHEWESNDGAPEELSGDLEIPNKYPVTFKGAHFGTHISLNGKPSVRLTIQAPGEIISGWNTFPSGDDLGGLADGNVAIVEAVPEGEYHFNLQVADGDFGIERVSGKTLKHNFEVKVNGESLPPGNGIAPKFGSDYDFKGANFCVLVY